MGEWGPSITAGKGCKRVGCVCTGGRTLSIDANPVAPHSTQFEERLWLLSENCDTPPLKQQIQFAVTVFVPVRKLDSHLTPSAYRHKHSYREFSFSFK